MPSELVTRDRLAALSVELKRVQRDARAAIAAVGHAEQALGGDVYGRASLPPDEPTDWDHLKALVELAQSEYPHHEIVVTIIARPLASQRGHTNGNRSSRT